MHVHRCAPMPALVLLFWCLLRVAASLTCPEEGREQVVDGATSGQCMLKRKIVQTQRIKHTNEDGLATEMAMSRSKKAGAAQMHVTAAAQKNENHVTLGSGNAAWPCTSKACEKAANWLEPFINTSVNPCQDFAAFTCSLQKKKALRKQCEACAEDDIVCQMTSCMGDDMGNLAMETRLAMRTIVKDASDVSKPPADFLGEGLSEVTQAVKVAHAACQSTPKFEDWQDQNETERKRVIVDKMGDAALDYIQRQMLPPDATMAELITHNGFAMEPLRNMGQLGTMGIYMNPFFCVLTGIDNTHPSQSTKITIIPAMCEEGFAVDGQNLSFTMDVAAELEKKLPGGKLFHEGTAQDAMSAFSELIKPHLTPCFPTLFSLVGADLDSTAPGFPLAALQDFLPLVLDVKSILGSLGVPDGVKVHIANFGMNGEWGKKIASLLSAETESRTKLALRFTRFHKYLEFVWLSQQDGPLTLTSDEPAPSCWLQVKKMFPWFFARKLVSDALTEEGRDRGEEIAWQMVETFADNLDALPWLDDETRLAAKKKLRHIHVKIGYPQWLMQDELLTRKYGYALSFNEFMTWAEITDIAGRAQVKDIMSTLGRPRDWESFWLTTPDVFNMMYNTLANDIIGLAAFMQRPQYDAEMPMFYNFGFYAAVIGHELTHGFDSNGAERGPFGDKSDWWTSSSRDKFEASKSCFENQYGSYPIHGDVGTHKAKDGTNGTKLVEVGINKTALHDNGTKCLGENMADSGGLGLAAMAYRRWQQRHGAEHGITVGGKLFTAEQLFFMRYGAGWCDLISNEGLQERIDNLGEPHSVGRLRVVGAVQNSRAFAKAFECPLTDSLGMNPKDKCEVWGIDVSLQTKDWSPKNGSVKSFKSSATSWHSAVSIVVVLAVLFK